MGGNQPRPHDERRGEDRAERALLHDHVDLGVAARAGTIWVGTDDGKVQLTQNHGGSWTDVTPALTAAGANPERWVSRVFASPHDAGTAFVSKSGFRNDDFAPYLYSTTDYGKTWTAIAGNLPSAPINVVVQDRKNRNLLIVGNDIGVFVSIDGGASVDAAQGEPADRRGARPDHSSARKRSGAWHLRPRALDRRHHAAAGTDGGRAREGPAHLFDIEPRARYGFSTQGMNYHLFGDKYLEVPNEPDATRHQLLREADAARARASRITDPARTAGPGTCRVRHAPGSIG